MSSGQLGEPWGQFHKWFCTLTPNFCTLGPTFEKLFTGPNDGRRARKFGAGRKTVYEMEPLEGQVSRSSKQDVH